MHDSRNGNGARTSGQIDYDLHGFVGIRLLRGEKLKDGVMGGPNKNVMMIKLMPITNDNLDQLYEEHLSKRGIADFIDGWYSEEEIEALFK